MPYSDILRLPTADVVRRGECEWTETPMRLVAAPTTIILLAMFVPARAADDVDFYEARIRPLFIKHCYECHSENSKKLQGGLKLDRAEDALKGGEGGAVLEPGKPDESSLIDAVKYQNGLQMPPAGRLSEREVADLVDWVKRGAVFPKSTAANTGAKQKKIDIAQGKEHWAFRALAVSEPAPAGDRAQEPARLDGAIRAALAKAGRQPTERASRQVLVRRAYFDVTGLPPSPEDVAAFVSDESPAAWPKLVDSLLASPHYGERWARFWLDLARYCDVPESWAETPAKAALYRDWVVAALNRDLPYDTFVKQQLAADLLPDAQPADMAALGFLGLSPTQWKELKLAPDVIKSVVAEEWEERINTVSSTVLGLTVACARCHDHKFDPITQEDYYALAGIFASIRQVPLPLLPKDEARRVTDAHVQVKLLEAEVERFTSMIRREPDKAEEFKKSAADAKAKADEIKQNTPHFADALAYAIEDAALSVLPDGENRTKLDFQLGQGQDVPMHVRGNPSRPAAMVPRRFLLVLSPEVPQTFTQGSGRRELAEAIFRDATPLAARVIVNRVWRHHFGRGLVDTPSNFGTQGSLPTHPELLDNLAARFVAAGWSLKWLHREILLSATYQQTSAVDAATHAADPDNLLLGHMPRRRLEVEAWRDSILAAGGTLDRAIGGAAVDLSDAANHRRTLYGTVKRSDLHDLLRLYDFPDPTAHSPGRIDTTTPLQQLFVLNSEFLGAQAHALAERVRREAPAGTSEQIDRAYQLLYSRAVSETERQAGLEFLGEHPDESAWQQYAEVLLASNELMFID